MIQYIITVTGPDRIGIVSDISNIITNGGGNIEESRMAKLSGDFAIIMLITTNKTQEDLKVQLRELEPLMINVRNTTKKETKERGATRQLVLTGADNEGIVNTVTSFLSDKDINIESMDTETVQAPMSGTTLFKMQAMIQIPQKIEIQALENNLTVLGESLSVELELICVN